MADVLVALVVGGTVLGGALSVVLATRGMVWGDQARTRIDQELRASIDLIGIDVRQAGERLPADFPAVEVTDGGGSPDTLILRRNLLGVVLPLCQDLVAGTHDDEIRIADAGPTPEQGCNPVPDGDGDSWPDNLGVWRAYRDAQGGTVRAYLYNPIDRTGEWFAYDADGSTTEFLGNGSTGTWQNDYGADEQCRIYILEQRTYAISGDVLQLTAGDDTAVPFNLAAGLTTFDTRVHYEDGSVAAALDATGEWTDIETLEITLTKQDAVGNRAKTRTVAGRFLPRNILSN